MAVVLREGLLYQYPAQLNEMALRVRIDESVFDELIVRDSDLDYDEFVVQPGTKFSVDGQPVIFKRFISQPRVDHFQPQDGDIWVSAELEAGGETMQPVFLIRGNQPSGIRDEIRELGLYAHLVSLNPETNEATLRLAKTAPREPLRIPLAVAPRSFRTDYVTLQAIEFPGINLFWMGSTSMMLGLLLSMFVRIRQRQRLPGDASE